MTTSGFFLIGLPYPPAAISPNARPSVRRRIGTVKAYRETCWAMIREALGRRQAPKWKRAELDAVFVHPDKRKRDPDNLAAKLKAAIDALVVAGIIEDDADLTILPIRQKLDAMNPRVELRVVACTSNRPSAYFAGLADLVLGLAVPADFNDDQRTRYLRAFRARVAKVAGDAKGPPGADAEARPRLLWALRSAIDAAITGLADAGGPPAKGGQ